jgi:lipoate-protein ligase B
MEYEKARRLQEDVAVARARRAIGDVLLLLGHPPVITIGQGGGEEDILAPDSQLRRAGIRVLLTDRGGRATYHGPGQLVAYPILELPGSDLHGYVRQLEEVVIRILGTYGLTAGRVAKHPGVWIERPMGSGHPGRKIAAVGIAVRNGVTRHGLALNVSPDLAHFELLIPCGIANREVTSMARELGWVPDLAEVVERFVRAFGDVFECQMVTESPGALARRLETPPGTGSMAGTVGGGILRAT